MKIILINNNIEIEKIFLNLEKNNFNYTLKMIKFLQHSNLERILTPKYNEYYFINLDSLEPKDILKIKNKEYKIFIDRIIFLTTNKLNKYNEIIINNSELKNSRKYTEKLEKIIKEKIEQKIFLQKKQNLNLTKNKQYTDINLEKIIEYNNNLKTNEKIIVIGSSIGGTSVLEEIIKNLNKKEYPPIIITQHILSNFVETMVKRISEINLNFKYKIVKEETKLENNNIYFSNGSEHLMVKREGKGTVITVSKSKEQVNKHKPSINVLFRSVANIYTKITAIILTGMGKDGIVGMGELYLKGAYTIAQNRESSIVHGMAGTCVEEGFIKEEINVNEIIKRIDELN